MLFRLWILPMDLWGWLLVTISGCTQDTNGDWWAPETSLLNRWMVWQGFAAVTPSYSYVIFKHGFIPSTTLYYHEYTHVEQHRRYGWFFPLVYGWYSLISWLNGTGWYRGNKLEREARGEL